MKVQESTNHNNTLMVRSFMQDPSSCSIFPEEITLERIIDVLDRTNSGVVFIIDKNLSLSGIVTQGDVRKSLKRIGNNFRDISEVINATPVCVSHDEDAAVALRLMRQHNFVILPVVEGKILVGYISIHALIASFSPERLYLIGDYEQADENQQKHINRYRFASMFVEGGNVLDCACGSGYGSKILASKADGVIGVDISNESIEFAKRHNNAPNISYLCQPLQNLHFKSHSLNSIISLETLEHVKKDDMISYLRRCAEWLNTGGCFIGSSPMLRFKDKKPYITNPYHVNELPRDVLISTVEECFPGFRINFFHQGIRSFFPLDCESTGFCVFVARKAV